jgi:hypothetical protein
MFAVKGSLKTNSRTNEAYFHTSFCSSLYSNGNDKLGALHSMIEEGAAKELALKEGLKFRYCSKCKA